MSISTETIKFSTPRWGRWQGGPSGTLSLTERQCIWVKCLEVYSTRLTWVQIPVLFLAYSVSVNRPLNLSTPLLPYLLNGENRIWPLGRFCRFHDVLICLKLPRKCLPLSLTVNLCSLSSFLHSIQSR